MQQCGTNLLAPRSLPVNSVRRTRDLVVALLHGVGHVRPVIRNSVSRATPGVPVIVRVLCTLSLLGNMSFSRQ